MAEIVALGWQAHSGRAALTGLRRREFPVQLAADESGRKAYRLMAAG